MCENDELSEISLYDNDVAIIIRSDGRIALVVPDRPDVEQLPNAALAAYIAAMLSIRDQDLLDLIEAKSKDEEFLAAAEAQASLDEEDPEDNIIIGRE